MQVEPGTDLALVLAMLYVIVDEGLWDRAFVDAYTNDPGLKRLSAHLAGGNKLGQAYTPEWAAPICGVPADVIAGGSRASTPRRRARPSPPATAWRAASTWCRPRARSGLLRNRHGASGPRGLRPVHAQKPAPQPQLLR